jgi:nitrogen regulatory protein P-II 2
MKLIVAVIQPEKLTDVKQALFEANITKMTVSNVIGCGQQMGYTESYRGAVTEINLRKKVRIEVAVNDEFMNPAIDAIIKGARSGNIGDGKIFITDMYECIKVRTGEKGNGAI